MTTRPTQTDEIDLFDVIEQLWRAKAYYIAILRGRHVSGCYICHNFRKKI